MLNQLTDAFIIRKKTNLDRSRWNLLTWYGKFFLKKFLNGTAKKYI